MMLAVAFPSTVRLILETINRVYRTLLMLPPQASSFARRIDSLQYFEVTIYTIIAIAYVGTGTFFILRYRRRPGHEVGEPVQGTGLTAVVAIGLFVLFLVFWMFGYWQFRTLRAEPAGSTDVYVIAKQWTWEFDYPTGRGSVAVLYVPVNRPIRLLLTSRDVIHSFFVPAFRLKQDAVPGTYTTAWFEATQVGVFPLMCSQLCGPGHPRMTGQVAVLGPEAFEQWSRGDDVAASVGATSFVDVGRRTAATMGCLRCHTIDGQRHIGPTWLGLYGSTQPLTDGTDVRADEAYLTASMMDPMAKIVRGYAPVMPSYQGLLTPADTAALVEYIKSLRRPSTPPVVTPPPAATIPAIPVPPSGSASGSSASGGSRR